ncbi:hypothetical protein DPMN_118961 [Dreissena polymorpha]|uniref:Uncharacterized protein n=1 Tax=Dreissena polymorpha TaxID=45954 RepID=A0A9D4GHF2_DREPO|nr:hypothetical protein DPMN_118961 [Dreissena polymorpha]
MAPSKLFVAVLIICLAGAMAQSYDYKVQNCHGNYSSGQTEQSVLMFRVDMGVCPHSVYIFMRTYMCSIS